MPQTLDLRQSEIAFALGASASSPAYALPVSSGLPVPRQSIATDDSTSPLVLAQSARKADLGWGASVSVPALPLSVGLLLKAALWSESVSGSTHTLTPGTVQRTITVFSRRPSPLYEKWTGGVVESLTISARAQEPVLNVDCEMVGISSVISTAYSAATTETMASYFSPFTGTFSFDFGAGSVTLNNVSEASVRLSRPSIVHGDYGSPGAFRIDQQPLKIEVSARIVYTDYAAYRAAFYGSTTGTTLSGSLSDGSFAMSSETDTDALVITVPRVAWTADAPEASGDGGPVIASVTGIGLIPTSGAAISAVLVNSRSTAY